jgi:hypothetical protein
MRMLARGARVDACVVAGVAGETCRLAAPSVARVAGRLIALSLAGLAGCASSLIALRLASLASVRAGGLVALRLARLASVHAGSLAAPRLTRLTRRLIASCYAGIASDAGLLRMTGIARAIARSASRPIGEAGRDTRCNAYRGHGCAWRSKPDVQIEFIHRLNRGRPDIMDRRVPREADAGRLLAGNRRLFGRHRRCVRHSRDQEFGVVIQLARQIKALITCPVTLARQSDQRNQFLRGDLPRLGFHPVDKWMLCQFLGGFVRCHCSLPYKRVLNKIKWWHFLLSLL